MKNNKSSRLLIVVEIFVIILAFVFGLYKFKNTNKVDESEFIDKVDLNNNDVIRNGNKNFEYYEKEIKFSDEVENIISKMSLKEKIGQLFILNPEDYYSANSDDQYSNSMIENRINDLPVGGILYSENNISSIDETKELFLSTNNISNNRIGLPMFIAVDDEGYQKFQFLKNGYNHTNLWMTENVPFEEYDTYLNDRVNDLEELGINFYFGFQLNDISDDDNPKACYSNNYSLIYEIIDKELSFANQSNIIYSAKYFPFDGNKNDLTLDELIVEDLLIYQLVIDSNVKSITVNDVYSKAIDENNPVLLSSKTIDLIRAQMGYDGLLISRPLKDSYLYENYSEEKLVVDIFNSGIDMIVNPRNYEIAYNAILESYEKGDIKKVRLHNALGRIIQNKLDIQF